MTIINNQGPAAQIDSLRLASNQTPDKNVGVGESTVTFGGSERLVRTERANPPIREGLANQVRNALSSFVNGLSARLAKIELPEMPRLSSPLQAIRDHFNSKIAGRDMTGARFLPQHEASVKKNFAGGAMASLDQITYKDGTVGMFKPDQKKGELTLPNSARNAGIPDNPIAANLAGRAVASAKLDQLLGTNLVPTTEFAVSEGRSGTVQEFAKGSQILKMGAQRDVAVTNNAAEFDIFISYYSETGEGGGRSISGTANGLRELRSLSGALAEITANAHRPPEPDVVDKITSLINNNEIWFEAEVLQDLGGINLSSPTVQQSLSDSGIFDFVSGQLDRNFANFIFSNSPTAASHSQLIDNDLSFGSNFTKLDSAALKAIGSDKLPSELPRLIDRGTADRLMTISADQILVALEDTGLNSSEIDATKSRLAEVQQHIQAISEGRVEGGRLVDNWNAETFSELLQKPDNYVQKCIEDQSIQLDQSPNKIRILASDVRSGGQQLANILPAWDARSIQSTLNNDARQSGDLIAGMIRSAPQLLTEMLTKADMELSGLLKDSAKGAIASALLEHQPQQLTTILNSFSMPDRESVIRAIAEQPMTSVTAVTNAAGLAKNVIVDNGGFFPLEQRNAGEQFLWAMNKMCGKSTAAGSVNPAGNRVSVADLMQQRAAIVHEGFSNGMLGMSHIDELFSELKMAIIADGEITQADVDAIDLNALSAFQLDNIPKPGLDEQGLIGLYSLSSYSALQSFSSPSGNDEFAGFLQLWTQMPQAIQTYNEGGGRDDPKFSANGPEFQREGAKITAPLLKSLRDAQSADQIRGILQQQGWEAVATNRFDLLQGPDAANNGLNDFLARHLFAFAVDGRVVS